MRISNQVPSSSLPPKIPLNAVKPKIQATSYQTPPTWRFEAIEPEFKSQSAINSYLSHTTESLWIEESPLGAVDIYA